MKTLTYTIQPSYIPVTHSVALILDSFYRLQPKHIPFSHILLETLYACVLFHIVLDVCLSFLLLYCCMVFSFLLHSINFHSIIFSLLFIMRLLFKIGKSAYSPLFLCHTLLEFMHFYSVLFFHTEHSPCIIKPMF